MDAAEYKDVVLGLIFLKYISDAFEEHHAKLESQRAQGADPEDPDEYRAVNIFWVPKEARWSHLKACAKQPTIGKVIDDAMLAVERDNPSLRGVLPKDYAHPRLDKQRLGQLIDYELIRLTDNDILHISGIFHLWRGDKDCMKKYEDAPSFCKSDTMVEMFFLVQKTYEQSLRNGIEDLIRRRVQSGS